MYIPSAFMFDLDGVITDTAEYHYSAWQAICDKYGFKFDRAFNEQLKGISRIDSIEKILEMNALTHTIREKEKLRIAEEKNGLYIELIEQISPKDILPGIMGFVLKSHNLGVKLSVASASRNADRVLTLLDVKKVFDYIADAAKTRNSKPNPDVFLDCAAKLAVPPEKCVGFEDAVSGIQAIKSAGMFSVGIGIDTNIILPDLDLRSTKELEKISDFDIFLRACSH